MGIDQVDIEIEARQLYRAAGLNSDVAAPPIWLATQILGVGAVLPIPSLRQSGGACLARVRGQYRIYYRDRLPPERRDFAVAHELAHWCLRERESNDLEADCDLLASALIAPRSAFLAVLRKHGARFPRLAQAFATSESLVALRFGETTLDPLALVTPNAVRVRGVGYSWPSEATIREIAARPRPGLKKAVLRDDVSRVTLRAI